MKLSDFLRDSPEWKELFRLTVNMMESGEKAKDSGLYMAGLELSQILGRLANREIKEDSK
jgi:hypothetical protein